MRLMDAIRGFEVSRLADGYAPITLNGYKSSLSVLSRYLGNPEVNEITTENLKAFFHHLRTDYEPERGNGSKDPLASASHHRYWKSIRCFFKWAAEDLKTGRPDLLIKMPAYTNKEISPFTTEEIQSMVRACEKSKIISDGKRRPYQFKRPLGLRNKALILVLLDTGVRAGEFCRLRIKDVNLDNGEVHVMPHHVRKTRPRTVYLGKVARKAVWRYLAERPDAKPDDRLIVTMYDHPMTQRSLLVEVKSIAEAAGVKNAHPHRFRHTFAIQLLRNGADVFTLQRLLGHATLEMVKHYLSLADSDASEAHRKASPADNWRL